jgi:O-antigen ligase
MITAGVNSLTRSRPGNAALFTVLALFCLALPFRVHAIGFTELVYLTPYDLLMGAAVVGLLVRVIDRKQGLQFPYWQGACLLLAGQLFSFVGGVSVYGVGALKILLAAFAAFYLGLNIPQSQKQVKRLIFLVIVAAGFVSLSSVVSVGLGQDVGYFLSHESREAAAASFQWGSVMAVFLLGAIPFALFTLLGDQDRLRRYVALVVVVAMTAAITLADIRSDLLAYFVAVVPFIRSKKDLLKLGGVFVLAIFVLFVLNPSVFDAVMLRITMQGPTAQSDIGNVATRLIAWQNCLQLWVMHPLFGVGAANWRYEWINADNADLVAPFAWVAQPHNVFMQLLAETGIIGLVTYVFFFGKMASVLRRIWRSSSRDPWVRGMAKAALVSTAAVFVAASFNGDLPYGDQISLLLFMLLGLALRSAQLHGFELVLARNAPVSRTAPVLTRAVMRPQTSR